MIVQSRCVGPSGSGKTAFSAKVTDFLPGVTVLGLDNYNDASRLIDGNFDGAGMAPVHAVVSIVIQIGPSHNCMHLGSDAEIVVALS